MRCPRLHAPEIYSKSSSCSGLGKITVDTDGTFEEGLVRILDSRDQVLRCKTVRLVKVIWQHEEWRRQCGNARTRCGPPILSYLRMKVCGLIFGIRILLHIHVVVCASMFEFRGRNSVKGGKNVQPEKNSIFLKNGKTVIWLKIENFLDLR